MAVGTATCTCSRCGRTFEVSAKRPSRKAADEWEIWAAQNYDICQDCEAEERRQQAAEYAAEAAADGLPVLRGTEKQVSWAERIRREKWVAMSAYISQTVAGGAAESAKEMEGVMNYVLSTNSGARWWIDHRFDSSNTLLRDAYQSAMDAKAVELASIAPTSKVPAKPEPVIHPENERYGTVRLAVTENRVEAYYPKDDAFRDVVKAAGCRWDSGLRCWAKGINQFTGSATERAAELASKLLTAGFAVQCQDAKVRELAVSGNFKAENKRWVKLFTSGSHEGWLAVWVPRRGEDDQGLYEAARKIKGSRYDSGSVAVPVARWKLVEDFAQLYGYEFSAGAQKAIAEFQVVNTIKPEMPPEPEQRDPLVDILNSSTDILPDLLDD